MATAQRRRTGRPVYCMERIRKETGREAMPGNSTKHQSFRPATLGEVSSKVQAIHQTAIDVRTDSSATAPGTARLRHTYAASDMHPAPVTSSGSEYAKYENIAAV